MLFDEAIRNTSRASIETVRVARPCVFDAWVCCLTLYIACEHYLTVVLISLLVG